jgi:outer membrane protein
MAQKDAELATRADMILAVDQAFYQALSSQAVLEVAKGTVKARQATADQIGALTASKLRSGLDQSFANVELSQAKLLMLDAQDAVEDSMEKLNALLGSEDGGAYTLVDETPKEAQLAPAEIEPLVRLAFTSRPDLSALNESYTAAVQLSAAEHDLKRPTVSALAAAGGTPVRADQITSSWYGAVGANVSIPIFNGFLYTARAREADLRAEAAKEEVRNLRELIARDVRTSALAAQAAYQRIGVASQLLDQSNMALDLAQTRYQLGLSGIVELSQAQLAQTQGQIAFANARFAFQQALAVLRFQTGQ